MCPRPVETAAPEIAPHDPSGKRSQVRWRSYASRSTPLRALAARVVGCDFRRGGFDRSWAHVVARVLDPCLAGQRAPRLLVAARGKDVPAAARQRVEDVRPGAAGTKRRLLRATRT